MSFVKTLVASVLVSAAGLFATELSAKAAPCMAILHGLDPTGTITNEQAAINHWDSAARSSFASGGVVTKYIQYDGKGTLYWNSAPGVAQQIVDFGNSASCKNASGGNDPLTVVAYSMGATVMDEILAQADANDPYYVPIYATAKDRILEVWTVDGVHGGAELADTYEFVNDLLFGFVDAVSGAYAIHGLTTSASPRAYGYTDVDRPVFAIGGYDGWWYTDPPGEDDGVVAYHSMYGARVKGSYYGDWRGNVTNDHWASNGLFYNAWQADKDHFEAKNSANHKIRKLKTSPITGYCNCENDSWFDSHNNPALLRTYAF